MSPHYPLQACFHIMMLKGGKVLMSEASSASAGVDRPTDYSSIDAYLPISFPKEKRPPLNSNRPLFFLFLRARDKNCSDASTVLIDSDEIARGTCGEQVQVDSHWG